MEIIFATHNPNKINEISPLLPDHFKLRGLDDVELTDPIPEPFNTLEENAKAKALWVYERYGSCCFADDTGLEVEALNGAPGVMSARYAGPNASAADNLLKLLDEMKDINHRNARFRTVIALILEDKFYTFTGMVEGMILRENHGNKGFGYDPVFLPDGHDQSFAEMELAQKNQISHRSIAVRKLIDFLTEL